MKVKSSTSSPLQEFTHSTIVTSGVLCAVGVYWFSQVAKQVPEPYLDEVFHVRQALAYYDNLWSVWDPKITTPPGLYVFSYVWLCVLQGGGRLASLTIQLRSLNLLAGVISLYFTSRRLLYIILKAKNDPHSNISSSEPQWKGSRLLSVDHTALNICLFPPLFFFYALFYTDVLSTELVLLAQSNFHSRNTKYMLLYSLLALTLRQTNIFWVAIYFGGLEVLRTLGKGHSETGSPVKPALSDVVFQSWQHGYLYDPPMSTAYFEDYLKCGISLLVASLANPIPILKSLTPYLTLLLTFGAFVLWNGGVVLGDKSNHTASLHLSQMLYIWPYITFFSLPLLTPYFLALIPDQFLPSPLRTHVLRYPLPRLIITIPTLAVMTAIVHYNTLIHPFTLADNRHYTFYVFRLLILCHPAVKYLTVPIYFVCAWAAMAALGGVPPPLPLTSATSHQQNPQRSENSLTQNTNEKPHPAILVSQPQSSSTTINSTSNENRTSFFLIYLLATALSLITASLVEPRYFILPWLIWRLHITPSFRRSTNYSPNILLIIETVYLLLINTVTGYIFLHRPFTWPQEEGKLQRFMW